jgi:serine protease Do
LIEEIIQVRYAYGITAALLLGGTAATLALQAPATSQSVTPANGVALTGAPKPGAPMSFADLAARLQPAVVNITTKKKISVGQRFDPSTGGAAPVLQQQEGGGSGFIISADGLIVTNNHVIASEQDGDETVVDSIMVRLTDRREYKAVLVGRDAASDIAVLRIEAKGLPFVEFGDSAQTRVGEWVIAIGNPLGLGSTVTAGIVSALQRSTNQGGAYDRFIQTDTAINRGNSGGPLFDLNGRVIGINNRLISPVGVNIGLNFAIPSESAIPVVNALKGGKVFARGYLGVGIAPVDEDVGAAFGLPKDVGEIVQRVEPGEAADKAGLKEGDVVTKVNGRNVTPEQTLSYIVANIRPGTRVPIDVIRDGKAMTLAAVVGTRPAENKIARRGFNPESKPPVAKPGDPKAAGSKIINDTLGMVVSPLDAEIAGAIGIDPTTKGVVIESVSPSSDAAQRGFQRGDVIMGINYKPTVTVDGLAAQVEAAKKAGRAAIMVQVRRRGIASAQVAIRIAE